MGVATVTAGAGGFVDRTSADTLKVKYAELLRQRGACVAADENALTAAEKAKCDWFAQEMQTVAGELKPTRSTNPLLDLISDGHGVSVLRLQMVVWTLILAVTCAVTLCRFLAPPILDPGVLALIGVSSGGYLGAKLQEK